MTVRADLAGTASGIAAAMMTLGGAAIANLSGWMIGSGESALPLAICIVSVSALAFFTAMATVSIERKAHPEGFANSGH
jgi:FtsH-binding integral membrane protein